jgi:osmotically-inducible protein OsmY
MNHNGQPRQRLRHHNFPFRVPAAVLAALAMATLCGCATYQKCGFGGCAGDPQITAGIEAKLRENLAIESWGIRVQTFDRTVYLYGLVDTDLERNIVESAALEVAGVRRVVNSIAVRNSVW